VSWKKSIEGISLHNHRVPKKGRDSTQCGFAVYFTKYLPWGKKRALPGDPAIENIYLQEKNSPGSGEKFIVRELTELLVQVKKREGLREFG